MLCNHQDAEAFATPKMPDYLGADQRKTKEDEKDDKPIRGERTRARAPSREGPAEARNPAASVLRALWSGVVTGLGSVTACPLSPLLTAGSGFFSY